MRTILLAALLLGLSAGVVSAASEPVFLPTNIGDRIELRITRTAQGVDAPQITTADLLVQRKGGDNILIERQQNGATVDSVLSVDAGGALQLAASERTTSSNADLRALLPLLDVALAFARGAVPPGGSVLLNIPMGQANSGSTVVVPLRTAHLVGADFDVQGSASTQLQGAESAQQQQPLERRRPGGFGGPGGPGGFGGPGGGGFGGRPGDGGAADVNVGGSARGRSAAGAMTVLVRIDGHISDGRVHRLVIAQTRELTVGGAPFVNAESWAIDVSSK